MFPTPYDVITHMTKLMDTKYNHVITHMTKLMNTKYNDVLTHDANCGNYIGILTLGQVEGTLRRQSEHDRNKTYKISTTKVRL